MKHLLYIILIVIAGFVGYWCGQQTWFLSWNEKPMHYNTQESLKFERAYANYLMEGLHWFYKNDSTYWNEYFMHSQEYKNIDSINQHDWEDFYLY